MFPEWLDTATGTQVVHGSPSYSRPGSTVPEREIPTVTPEEPDGLELPMEASGARMAQRRADETFGVKGRTGDRAARDKSRS